MVSEKANTNTHTHIHAKSKKKKKIEEDKKKFWEEKYDNNSYGSLSNEIVYPLPNPIPCMAFINLFYYYLFHKIQRIRS